MKFQLILVESKSIVKIYTDGSSKGNPGNGGYGIVMKWNGETKEMAQGYRRTTNNRMELLAVIAALESLKSTKFKVKVYSDSKYVIDSITKGWVFNWQRINFREKKNADLWKRYLEIHGKFDVEFNWVKGHAGHAENERCDMLAVAAATSRVLHLIDEGFEESENQKLKV